MAQFFGKNQKSTSELQSFIARLNENNDFFRKLKEYCSNSEEKWSNSIVDLDVEIEYIKKLFVFLIGFSRFKDFLDGDDKLKDPYEKINKKIDNFINYSLEEPSSIIFDNSWFKEDNFIYKNEIPIIALSDLIEKTNKKMNVGYGFYSKVHCFLSDKIKIKPDHEYYIENFIFFDKEIREKLKSILKDYTDPESKKSLKDLNLIKEFSNESFNDNFFVLVFLLNNILKKSRGKLKFIDELYDVIIQNICKDKNDKNDQNVKEFLDCIKKGFKMLELGVVELKEILNIPLQIHKKHKNNKSDKEKKNEENSKRFLKWLINVEIANSASPSVPDNKLFKELEDFDQEIQLKFYTEMGTINTDIAKQFFEDSENSKNSESGSNSREKELPDVFSKLITKSSRNIMLNFVIKISSQNDDTFYLYLKSKEKYFGELEKIFLSLIKESIKAFKKLSPSKSALNEKISNLENEYEKKSKKSFGIFEEAAEYLDSLKSPFTEKKKGLGGLLSRNEIKENSIEDKFLLTLFVPIQKRSNEYEGIPISKILELIKTISQGQPSKNPPKPFSRGNKSKNTHKDIQNKKVKLYSLNEYNKNLIFEKIFHLFIDFKKDLIKSKNFTFNSSNKSLDDFKNFLRKVKNQENEIFLIQEIEKLSFLQTGKLLRFLSHNSSMLKSTLVLSYWEKNEEQLRKIKSIIPDIETIRLKVNDLPSQSCCSKVTVVFGKRGGGKTKYIKSLPKHTLYIDPKVKNLSPQKLLKQLLLNIENQKIPICVEINEQDLNNQFHFLRYFVTDPVPKIDLNVFFSDKEFLKNYKEFFEDSKNYYQLKAGMKFFKENKEDFFKYYYKKITKFSTFEEYFTKEKSFSEKDQEEAIKKFENECEISKKSLTKLYFENNPNKYDDIITIISCLRAKIPLILVGGVGGGKSKLISDIKYYLKEKNEKIFELRIPPDEIKIDDLYNLIKGDIEKVIKESKSRRNYIFFDNLNYRRDINFIYEFKSIIKGFKKKNESKVFCSFIGSYSLEDPKEELPDFYQDFVLPYDNSKSFYSLNYTLAEEGEIRDGRLFCKVIRTFTKLLSEKKLQIYINFRHIDMFINLYKYLKQFIEDEDKDDKEKRLLYLTSYLIYFDSLYNRLDDETKKSVEENIEKELEDYHSIVEEEKNIIQRKVSSKIKGDEGNCDWNFTIFYIFIHAKVPLLFYSKNQINSDFFRQYFNDLVFNVDENGETYTFSKMRASILKAGKDITTFFEAAKKEDFADISIGYIEDINENSSLIDFIRHEINKNEKIVEDSNTEKNSKEKKRKISFFGTYYGNISKKLLNSCIVHYVQDSDFPQIKSEECCFVVQGDPSVIPYIVGKNEDRVCIFGSKLNVTNDGKRGRSEIVIKKILCSIVREIKRKVNLFLYDLDEIYPMLKNLITGNLLSYDNRKFVEIDLGVDLLKTDLVEVNKEFKCYIILDPGKESKLSSFLSEEVKINYANSWAQNLNGELKSILQKNDVFKGGLLNQVINIDLDTEKQKSPLEEKQKSSPEEKQKSSPEEKQKERYGAKNERNKFKVFKNYLSQDVIEFLKTVDNIEQTQLYFINKIEKKEFSDFKTFCEKVRKEKSIIYTFSPKEENLKFCIREDSLIYIMMLKILVFSTLYLEEDIKNQIKEFYLSKKSFYLIIRMDESEVEHIPFINYLIDTYRFRETSFNFQGQNKNGEIEIQKKVVFIISKKREKNLKKVTFNPNYIFNSEIYFIDDINDLELEGKEEPREEKEEETRPFGQVSFKIPLSALEEDQIKKIEEKSNKNIKELVIGLKGKSTQELLNDEAVKDSHKNAFVLDKIFEDFGKEQIESIEYKIELDEKKRILLKLDYLLEEVPRGSYSKFNYPKNYPSLIYSRFYLKYFYRGIYLNKLDEETIKVKLDAIKAQEVFKDEVYDKWGFIKLKYYPNLKIFCSKYIIDLLINQKMKIDDIIKENDSLIGSLRNGAKFYSYLFDDYLKILIIDLDENLEFDKKNKIISVFKKLVEPQLSQKLQKKNFEKLLNIFESNKFLISELFDILLRVVERINLQDFTGFKEDFKENVMIFISQLLTKEMEELCEKEATLDTVQDFICLNKKISTLLKYHGYSSPLYLDDFIDSILIDYSNSIINNANNNEVTDQDLEHIKGLNELDKKFIKKFVQGSEKGKQILVEIFVKHKSFDFIPESFLDGAITKQRIFSYIISESVDFKILENKFRPFKDERINEEPFTKEEDKPLILFIFEKLMYTANARSKEVFKNSAFIEEATAIICDLDKNDNKILFYIAFIKIAILLGEDVSSNAIPQIQYYTEKVKKEKEQENLLFQENESEKESEVLIQNPQEVENPINDSKPKESLDNIDQEKTAPPSEEFYNLEVEKILVKDVSNESLPNEEPKVKFYWTETEDTLVTINKEKIKDFPELLTSLITMTCEKANKMKIGFFKQMFGREMKKMLQKDYPGKGKLKCLEVFEKSIQKLTNYLKDPNRDRMTYICPCGQWYTIGECGFPISIFKCSNCNEDIGGLNHQILDKPGHYLVCKDENHLKEVQSISFSSDANKKKMITLEHLIAKVSLSVPTYEDISQFNKTQDELPLITYRLIFFIIFSFIYCWTTPDVITLIDKEKDLEKKEKFSFPKLVDSIKENWDILSLLLKHEKINNPRVFMIILFDILTKDQGFQEKESPTKQDLENQINNYVDKAKESYHKITITKEMIDQLEEKGRSYIENELIITGLYKCEEMKFYSLPSFIREEKEFQIYLKIKEDFYKKEYPVVYYYFLSGKKSEIKDFEMIKKINPFVKTLLNLYSDRISRSKAKEAKIKDVVEKHSLELEFGKFKEGWKELSKKKYNYNGKPLSFTYNPEESISEEAETLMYYLLDDNEVGYGINLVAAYNQAIQEQNQIIETIVENSGEKRKYLKNILSSKTIIQKSFDENYFSFEKDEQEIIDLINERSYYSDGQIKFDFHEIEDQFENYFVLRKKRFEDDQNFVDFLEERFDITKTKAYKYCVLKYIQEDLKSNEGFYFLNNDSLESVEKKLRQLEEEIYSIASTDAALDPQNPNQKIKPNHIESVLNRLNVQFANFIKEKLPKKFKKLLDEKIVSSLRKRFVKKEDKRIDQKNYIIDKTTFFQALSKFIIELHINPDLQEADNKTLQNNFKNREKFWGKEKFFHGEFDKEVDNIIKDCKSNIISIICDLHSFMEILI